MCHFDARERELEFSFPRTLSLRIDVWASYIRGRFVVSSPSFSLMPYSIKACDSIVTPSQISLFSARPVCHKLGHQKRMAST